MPDRSTRVKRLACPFRAAEDEAQERAAAREEQRDAGQLGIRRVGRLAPEVMPAGDADDRRNEIGRIAKQLERQLGEKRAHAPDEIRGWVRRAGREEPHRVRRVVRDERDQPDQRQRKQRDADELADTARQRRLSQRSDLH